MGHFTLSSCCLVSWVEKRSFFFFPVNYWAMRNVPFRYNSFLGQIRPKGISTFPSSVESGPRVTCLWAHSWIARANEEANPVRRLGKKKDHSPHPTWQSYVQITWYGTNQRRCGHQTKSWMNEFDHHIWDPALKFSGRGKRDSRNRTR